MGLEEWELLLGVSILSEPMGQAFADLLSLVGQTGYTVSGERVEAAGEFDLSDLADAVRSDELTGTYHAETLRALRQRLSSLDNTGLFSAVGTRINELLAPGRASVILLNRLAQGYRAAVVSVLTRMLIEARSEAAFAEKRLALDPEMDDETRTSLRALMQSNVPRTVVVLDEAQSFLSPGSGSPARQLFVRLVKEGRNMGLSAILATQQPSAMDSRVLSQVETFVTHQLVTEQDIRAVRENLKSAMPSGIQLGSQHLDTSGLIRQLPPGTCLISAADINTTVRRSIVVSIRPRATVHGGIEL
jgi:DNA helicase HerA-like ATPase